ncbi:MAG: heavy metal translocating P-type ATPase [Bacillota bacterium]|nr:MAG: heavy metal translocating P-type ATPase [Bacillota bacterium]
MRWSQADRDLLQLLVPAGLILAGWTLRWASAPAFAHTLAMTAAAVYAGVPIGKEAWTRLRHKQFSIPLLITVASIGALSIGEAWEAAAVTFLYRFGGWLENLTLHRTRAALRDLLDLRPVTAWVRRRDPASGTADWEEIPADQVQVGETVLVRPGDRVPVDGTVVAGWAVLDTAALTGEPLPKEVSVGDKVWSGSISQAGSIEVAAERVAADTIFNRLIRLVAQAQNDKPRVQRFLDRFAQWYTPAVLLASAGVVAWTGDLELALTLLVIACPGALVVAAPVAVVAGLGQAARQGILIKGGERLELVGRVDAVAFDKTGTLTKGAPAVSSIEGFGANIGDVIAWAMAAEERSEHHLAAAILEFGRKLGVKPMAADTWHFYPGRGVAATAGQARVLVGNRRLMEENGVLFDRPHEQALAERTDAGEALDKVPAAIELSRRISRVIKANVTIAVATVLLLLAGVVTRHVGLGLGMLVHEASILLVIANGMRLLRPVKRPAASPAAARLAKEVVS